MRENNENPDKNYVAIILNVTGEGSYDWNIGYNNHDPNMNNNLRGLVEVSTCEK